MLPLPTLTRHECDGIGWWTDDPLAESGARIVFSERTGGKSFAPYDSLNLAGHVEDDPGAVDGNRTLLLDVLGLGGFEGRLTTAEQIHGIEVASIDESGAGSGARVTSGRGPVAGADSLVTSVAGIPLMLLFADCVPVILVAPGPVVAVAHAGWRGALGRIAGLTVEMMRDLHGVDPGGINAYIGPHIGACHYEVGDDVLSRFVREFGTVATVAQGRLDLRAVVSASLTDAGVDSCRIAALGVCTAERTDRFFSYRAEGGRTGRHGALACIVPSSPSS